MLSNTQELWTEIVEEAQKLVHFVQVNLQDQSERVINRTFRPSSIIVTLSVILAKSFLQYRDAE